MRLYMRLTAFAANALRNALIERCTDTHHMVRKTLVLTIGTGLFAACAVVAGCASDSATGTSRNTGTIPNTRAPSGSISCGSTKAIFTQSPVALGDFFGWVPLGNLGPPAHTFPTDHQYIYVNDPSSQAPRREVDIVAPTDIIITTAHFATNTPGGSDYTLEFSPCAEVYAKFGHVLTIAPAILSQLGAFDQFCNSYSPAPSASVTTCQTKFVAIRVRAGEVIGTAGGAAPHSFGLDFWLWDARVPAITYANTTHWSASNDKFDSFHIVPASDYFAEPANTRIVERVGSFDGKTRRTALPLGGSIGVDVAGTAMGFWFNASQPTYPEVPHLAISPDNVNPARMAFSIGTSLAGWSRGLVLFTPVNSGIVNRDPSQITADGTIYCFEAPGSWAILARMMDATTLRLEAEPQTVTTCAAAQPWTFTAAAFDYRR
jgi:hypothetical protein